MWGYFFKNTYGFNGVGILLLALNKSNVDSAN